MKQIKIIYEYIIETEEGINDELATDLITSKVNQLNGTELLQVISTRVISNEILLDDTLNDYTVSLEIDVQAKDTEDAIDKVLGNVLNVDYTSNLNITDVNSNGIDVNDD